MSTAMEMWVFHLYHNAAVYGTIVGLLIRHLSGRVFGGTLWNTTDRCCRHNRHSFCHKNHVYQKSDRSTIFILVTLLLLLSLRHSTFVSHNVHCFVAADEVEPIRTVVSSSGIGGGTSSSSSNGEENNNDTVDPWTTFTSFLQTSVFGRNDATETNDNSEPDNTYNFWNLLDGTGPLDDDTTHQDPSVGGRKFASESEHFFTRWNQFLQNFGASNDVNPLDVTDDTTEQQNQRHSSEARHQRDVLAELLEAISSQHQRYQHPSDIHDQLSFPQMIDLFWNTTQQIRKQLEITFKDVLDLTLPIFNPLQLYYYMLQQEIQYNAVYKRRQHAFMTEVSENMAMQLADGLYLSQLAYVNDCPSIVTNLERFHNNSWVVINCTTVSKPYQPAHFLAIRRVREPLQWNYTVNYRYNSADDDEASTWWNKLRQALNLTSTYNHTNTLEAVLVVRGTKDVADMMSDALLEPTQYGENGKAHDGIYKSSIWLHDTYREFLERMVLVTGRSKLKLWLVGHSLGAGTAALACLEFNKPSSYRGTTASTTISNINGDTTDYSSGSTIPLIDAYALGFGTPAVLSKELSEEVRSKVTTVINDADCVPRMSGTTLVNMWLNIASSEHWITEAAVDIQLLTTVLKENLPFPDLTEKVMSSLKDWLTLADVENTTLKSVLAKKIVPPVLFPPGECVHLYRDGMGWQGVYYPCFNFKAIEGVLFMVDDHLIPTGYYQGLLGYIRGLRSELNWRFKPDLIDLPVY
jgi:Lipase (class 3)